VFEKGNIRVSVSLLPLVRMMRKGIAIRAARVPDRSLLATANSCVLTPFGGPGRWSGRYIRQTRYRQIDHPIPIVIFATRFVRISVGIEL
jgi:hypothetical protein